MPHSTSACSCPLCRLHIPRARPHTLRRTVGLRDTITTLTATTWRPLALPARLPAIRTSSTRASTTRRRHRRGSRGQRSSRRPARSTVLRLQAITAMSSTASLQAHTAASTRDRGRVTDLIPAISTHRKCSQLETTVGMPARQARDERTAARMG